MASKQGVCHGRVLVDCDHAIKSRLNLEKVVPAMVEKKVFTKKTGKRIRKGQDMELFLAILKGKPFNDFLTFLNVIQSFGREDKETAVLMRIMSGPLNNLVSTDQTVLDTISSFILASQEDKITGKYSQSQQDPGTTNLSVETDTHFNMCSAESPVTGQVLAEQDSSVRVKTDATFEFLHESTTLHSKPTTEKDVSSEIPSTILPPQTSPRQLSSHPVSHTQILTDLEHAIRQHLNLEKVVPEMVARKVFIKKLGKHIVKHQEKEMFLGLMKEKPIHDFKIFLEVLLLVGGEDKETRLLMKKMSGLVDQITTTDPEVQSTISTFVETSKEDSELKSLQTESESHQVEYHTRDSSSLNSEEPETDVKTNTSTASESFPELSSIQQSLPSTNLRPHRPPPGFTGECMSRPFTHEGGMLYLSEHGVTVIIPSGAVPVGEKFVMSVHVYLHGPFSLLDDVEPCSAIVWFGVQPPMEFQKDVTVKIPHAAAVEVEQDGSDDLCSANTLGVYRTPKEGSRLKQLGQVYQLTQRIPGDFQDGYHAVFKVRHFSPHVVGKENDSSNKHASRNTGYNSSSSLHVVESRKQLLSNSNMSQLLRSFSSSLESQGSFEDSGASGSSSPIVSALRENPNVQFTSPPLSTSISNNVFGESSSAQPSRRTSGGGKRLSTKKKANLKSSKSKRRVGDIKFCIALCMPGDRSMTEWEATFAVCYNHPTGNSALKKYALKRYGEGFDIIPMGILFTDNGIELTPVEWTSDDNHWTVSADQTPMLSIQDVLMQLPSDSLLETDSETFCKETAGFLPHVTYSIQSSVSPPSSSLRRKIDVCGAVNSMGNGVFFTLKSTSAKKTAPIITAFHPNTIAVPPSRTLYLRSYLYDKTSGILAALTSSSDLQLDLAQPDHVKFLANLSFQLATIDVKILTQIFHFEECQYGAIYSADGRRILEAIYDALTKWVTRNKDGARLSLLREMLNRANIFIRLSDDTCNELQNILLHPRFDSIPIPYELHVPDTFLLNVSQKIQNCWKPVGRLMGIHENELDTAEQHDSLNNYEQSYFLLREWRKHNGNQATYGILFRAVQCVWDHDPLVVRVSDARCYLVNEAEKMLQQLST